MLTEVLQQGSYKIRQWAAHNSPPEGSSKYFPKARKQEMNKWVFLCEKQNKYPLKQSDLKALAGKCWPPWEYFEH